MSQEVAQGLVIVIVYKEGERESQAGRETVIYPLVFKRVEEKLELFSGIIVGLPCVCLRTRMHTHTSSLPVCVCVCCESKRAIMRTCEPVSDTILNTEAPPPPLGVPS